MLDGEVDVFFCGKPLGKAEIHSFHLSDGNPVENLMGILKVPDVSMTVEWLFEMWSVTVEDAAGNEIIRFSSGGDLLDAIKAAEEMVLNRKEKEGRDE